MLKNDPNGLCASAPLPAPLNVSEVLFNWGVILVFVCLSFLSISYELAQSANTKSQQQT